MRAWFFSENAYHLLPDAREYDSIRVQLPNRLYDPKLGADLYHRFIDEWVIAEDLGLEIMVNEHHQTATNLNPSAAVVMGTLGRVTRKARLLILGNPIANRKEPVRVAEEMAMVDVYSRGRLECGFVRGVPYELSAGNHRPTHMMERFWEAHDLIVKAWTSHDGPFNWEGKYFHHRQVNIWPRPYQDPHPPIWITALSPSSAAAVGEKGYVVACFLTGWDGTKAVFGTYRQRRAELGLSAPAWAFENVGFPFFCDPNHDTLIECLPTCHAAANPPKYPPIAFGDYAIWFARKSYEHMAREPALANAEIAPGARATKRW
jgi:alkanesulfonate monooxygenase SsuD/methylene tetrahydromethanopterin reductase-like flavin-dependent oxidoreductase (luciferase family)